MRRGSSLLIHNVRIIDATTVHSALDNGDGEHFAVLLKMPFNQDVQEQFPIPAIQIPITILILEKLLLY